MKAAARTHLVVGTVIVAVTATLAIALMLDWLPWVSTPAPPPPKIAVMGAAPPETLSPGESVVGETPPPQRSEPAAPPPAPRTEPKAVPATPPSPPPARPQPVKPRFAQREPAETAEIPMPSRECPQCGRIYLTATERDEFNRIVVWEVRVRFETGQTRVFRFDANPRFRVGDEVRLERGRLRRERD